MAQTGSICIGQGASQEDGISVPNTNGIASFSSFISFLAPALSLCCGKIKVRSGADVREWDITKQIKHRFRMFEIYLNGPLRVDYCALPNSI